MSDFFAGAIHAFGIVLCALTICGIISLREGDEDDER